MNVWPGLLALAIVATAQAKADSPQSSEADLAVRGYDVVAYFEQSKALSGSALHTIDWNGARWQFYSASNLDLFKKDPARYVPRFDGHCALTVAHGARIPANPEAWAIREDRLYLFFHKPARETWLMNPEQLISRAEAQWKADEVSP